MFEMCAVIVYTKKERKKENLQRSSAISEQRKNYHFSLFSDDIYFYDEKCVIKKNEIVSSRERNNKMPS